jgi:polyisoprenyl-teichoic acid--peptidoglycan teichoic acid transferase
MSILAQSNYQPKKRFYKRRWFKILSVIILIAVIGGGAFLWKTGYILNKISTKGGIFKSIIHALPGVEDKLKGENEDRINILLLGMRGENVPGGGLLADTIMVASIKPAENKVSLISIPRDLYVDNPGWGNKTKINAVYAAGEENGKKKGIEDMEKVISDISGIPIHYGLSINFKGFTDLIDAMDGITVHLDEPFAESLQFHEPHVCDSYVYTIPTNPPQFEYKYHVRNDGTKYVAKAYPLCYNSNEECGGNFSLPAGDNQLNGTKALCYVRSRYASSDFDRAKRQQIVIQEIKDKAFSLGTLADFGKVNGIFNALGDNVRTDLEPWEMEHLFSLYQKMNSPQMFQRVLENSEEGFLYNPPETPEAGYILLPRGDNYDRIRSMFRDIFAMTAQSDIKPK